MCAEFDKVILNQIGCEYVMTLGKHRGKWRYLGAKYIFGNILSSVLFCFEIGFWSQWWAWICVARQGWSPKKSKWHDRDVPFGFFGLQLPEISKNSLVRILGVPVPRPTPTDTLRHIYTSLSWSRTSTKSPRPHASIASLKKKKLSPFYLGVLGLCRRWSSTYLVCLDTEWRWPTLLDL